MANRIDYSRLIICLFMLVTSLRCSSWGGIESDDQLRSLNTLHQAVKYAMADSIMKRSQNTRVYFSNYHKPGKDINAGTLNSKKRAQLIMKILGDRRPYRIVVQYRVEELSGGSFSLDRYDKELARYYLGRVESYLASRPDRRDMIDDFRPY